MRVPRPQPEGAALPMSTALATPRGALGARRDLAHGWRAAMGPHERQSKIKTAKHASDMGPLLSCERGDMLRVVSGRAPQALGSVGPGEQHSPLGPVSFKYPVSI